MNTLPEALPEIDIGQFRKRYPQLFSDSGVDEIYCGPGWKTYSSHYAIRCKITWLGIQKLSS